MVTRRRTDEWSSKNYYICRTMYNRILDIWVSRFICSNVRMVFRGLNLLRPLFIFEMRKIMATLTKEQLEQHRIEVRDKIFDKVNSNFEPGEWWKLALDIMGYKSTEEYQKNIYPKYKYSMEEWVMGNRKKVPIKQFRILGWIVLETKFKNHNVSSEDLRKLVLYASILIDSEKHMLNWKKAYEELNIKTILNSAYGNKTH